MPPSLKLLLPLLFISNTAFAQTPAYPKAKVSFADFKQLVAEVEPHRASRLISLNTFLKMSQEPGVVILDTRSDFRFERIHLRGARHLSFSDFTQANLSKIIPSFDTKVLIYCNNNFDGNQRDFATKSAGPILSNVNRLGSLSKSNVSNDTPATQIAAQERPLTLALNIPTYINLYGYGYRNVYELDEWVNVNDPRIVFEGSVVKRK